MFRHRYLILAAVFAVLGALIMGLYIEKLENEIAGKGQHTSVVVAKSSVEKGTELEQRLVEERLVPSHLVPRGAVSELQGVEGKHSAIELTAGEVIIADRLLNPEEQGIAWQLEPNQRAFAVSLAGVSGLEQELIVGTQVDILGTLLDYRSGVEHSLMVLEGVTLLDLTAQPDPYGEAHGKQTVVLAVTPEEAKRLALFNTSGSLQLLIRSSEADKGKTAQTRPLATADLLDLPELEAPETAVHIAKDVTNEPIWRVEVIKGTVSTFVTDES